MKNVISVFVAVMFSTPLFAQDKKESPYTFEMVRDLKASPVKNQFRSGTCWSFATTSFLESEIYRTSNKLYDLADMYPVYCAYMAKADRYVRLHGQTNFPTGGASGDVLWTFQNFGIIPEEAYPGLNYGEEKHDHGVLDKFLKSIVEATTEDTKILNPNWKFPFTAMLNAYLGEAPTEFTFEGKSYSPKTFAESTKLNMSDYVKITSYTHHPFYGRFAIEVPDNWLMHEAYNVPLREFVEIAQNAINNGYTVSWGGDVSNKGFSWKHGLAIVPDETQQDNLTGTERDKWESMNEKERAASVYTFDKIVKEQVVSQGIRQKAFDSWDATDDHDMHITGLAKDQNGNTYFKVKNSWDVDNPYQGYCYMSIPYFQRYTLDIRVHKNAIPTAIKAKLGIK
ncbi:MAG: aminopeptidase [Bacteroidales bacterium]|jgi:bleomycin hydrolase|nr:aminopeptidase [Bacteroidales bacterium]